ncbi:MULTISPECIES: DUF4148 domain-containing protein [Delftia]|uniref:DUF4148 domain-containing protein n=1 Tax=Delftia lacustris TaxID=558537 RepID=A0A1H3TV80_9BURK|nr:MULTISPECIES: DUF4148 domain-containing protein [Delftia]EPD41541.1 hypothetical protein HMPREF9701_02096 [Delftia acidovorans CCUG 274B]PZP55954.1 MAG: DUF4148 domain-containing protein [Delftia acidovorans]SDZ54106.1 protein of unknown function [Delftia lacustris]
MTHRRPSLSSILSTSIIVTALGLPGMASAEYWHPAYNEAGVIVHPQHFKSTKTRAQVRAEVRDAIRAGTLRYGENSYPPPIVSKGPGKTRQEVINELINEPPEERAARMRLYSEGGG